MFCKRVYKQEQGIRIKKRLREKENGTKGRDEGRSAMMYDPASQLPEAP
jgi:hypothetical protein